MKIHSKQKVEGERTTISSGRRHQERLDAISFHVAGMVQLAILIELYFFELISAKYTTNS
jgi:hypothetical protein